MNTFERKPSMKAPVVRAFALELFSFWVFPVVSSVLLDLVSRLLGSGFYSMKADKPENTTTIATRTILLMI